MLSKGAAELRVAVVDQKTRQLPAVVEIHQQVARPLHHPSGIRMAAVGDVFDPTRPDRDEEQQLQPPQPEGVDGEQVTGEDHVSLLAQERPPAGDGALGCGRDAGAAEHVAHQPRRHRDAKPA